MGAGDLAALVQHIPAILRGRDINARLTAARTWTTVTASSSAKPGNRYALDKLRAGLDGVAFLLGKTAPQEEEEAAAGALGRIVRDPYHLELVP